jgi:hypothetical protein
LENIYWAVQNCYIERNIVEGMSLPETKRPDQYREVFDREDFKVEHGVNIIRINSVHDKKLKSKAAERLILVHPELEKRGKDVTYGRYGKLAEAKRQLEVIKKLTFSLNLG